MFGNVEARFMQELINSGDMISRKQNMQKRVKMQSWFDSDCSLIIMKGAKLSTPPRSDLSIIQVSETPNYISLSRKTEGIDICTKDEIRGDFLRPPHKQLTPATVDINTF